MKVKSPATSLKFELTNQIRAMHSARDDVYIQVPDIKKEDMIPWSMEHTWFYPLCLDCESNQMTLLFVMDKGIGIHTHYHCGQTFAYTLQGRWRYVEAEDKVMVPGTFILEFPGR
jgi:quercetin dioxygenase-like cupin family protein